MTTIDHYPHPLGITHDGGVQGAWRWNPEQQRVERWNPWKMLWVASIVSPALLTPVEKAAYAITWAEPADE